MTRSYAQRVWSGDQERLVQVQEILEDALEQEYNRAVSKLGPPPEEEDYGRYARRVEDLADAFKLRVVVHGRNGRWEREGEIGAILAAEEPDDIERIELRNGFSTSRSQISVRFRETEYRDAVEVTVTGADRTWVVGTTEHIADALKRGRPWWALLCRPVLPIVLALFTYLTALVALYTVVPANSFSTSEQTLVWILLALLYIVSMWLATRFQRWALPRFEVRSLGRSSAAPARLRLVGGIVAFVLGNVLIPVLLSYLLGQGS